MKFARDVLLWLVIYLKVVKLEELEKIVRKTEKFC